MIDSFLDIFYWSLIFNCPLLQFVLFDIIKEVSRVAGKLNECSYNTSIESIESLIETIYCQMVR